MKGWFTCEEAENGKHEGHGRVKKKMVIKGWEGKKRTLVINHQHIAGRGREAACCREKQVCGWVADKRQSITYASLAREHQSGAGGEDGAFCLCERDKKSVVCYRLSLGTAFTFLVMLEHPIPLFFQGLFFFFSPSHASVEFLSSNSSLAFTWTHKFYSFFLISTHAHLGLVSSWILIYCVLSFF